MRFAKNHPAAALALLAFILRAGVAVVTEFKPIFPAYYYTDAVYADQMAGEILDHRARGERFIPSVSPSKRVHAAALAGLYRVFGRRPLAAKLANAAIGGLIVGLFFWGLAPAFGTGPAAASALALALWPTHAFFTSQNFKDGATMLTAYLAVCAGLRCLKAPEEATPWKPLAALAAGLILTGFLRSYLLATVAGVTAAVGAVAAAGAWRGGRPWKNPALVLGASLLSVAVYLPLSRAVFNGPLAPNRLSGSDPTIRANLLPSTFDEKKGAYISPFSPRGISETRRIRQISDQAFAQIYTGRRIATQLFYGVEFDSWWDVARFLPKAMFHVLFMPLPFFYPSEGKLGRMLASGEDFILLLAALAAFVGAARRPRDPARGLLLALFGAMAAGSALLEFDLGSAARHRILHMPWLFPFAFCLFESIPPRKGRRKIFQVLECGGPGGTGNQVAAICDGLDKEKFEVGLVYGVRTGAPEEYRKTATGAEKEFYLTELTREITPIEDIRALWKLWRIFVAERPDVIHAHSSKGGFLARIAGFLARVPKIYYSPRGYGFLQQDRSAASRLLYKILESAASTIGEVIAISPSEAKLAESLSWGAPVRLAQDPFLGEILPPAPPSPGQGVLVGACGRLTFARNPEAFVLLSQRVTDSRNGVRCVWIGAGELEAGIRADLTNMNLLNRFEITGWLEPAQARERLRGLSVFVHYSRWEGLPNAVLDAMALGLPVVASDIPGNRDAVVHGQTGFLAADEVELLEFTLKLLDDAELRRRFGEAGRERVRTNFNKEETFRALENLYEG
mgnify:CR=1 FL=1